MKKYIFDEWTPNLWLLAIALGLYTWLIVITDFNLAILIFASWITFGWAIAFSKKQEVLRE